MSEQYQSVPDRSVPEIGQGAYVHFVKGTYHTRDTLSKNKLWGHIGREHIVMASNSSVMFSCLQPMYLDRSDAVLYYSSVCSVCMHCTGNSVLRLHVCVLVSIL
jgi:hypothetical protein